MSFDTTLKQALAKSDLVTILSGDFRGPVEHQYHDADNVMLEVEDEMQIGEFPLDQPITVDGRGTSAIQTIPDEDGRIDTFLVMFQCTVPLNAEHLK